MNLYYLQCKIEVIDIGDEKNSLWLEKYKYDIPVIHLNGKFLMKHKVFDSALEDAIINANAKARFVGMFLFLFAKLLLISYFKISL